MAETRAPTVEPTMAPAMTSVIQCRSATTRSRLEPAAMPSAAGQTKGSALPYSDNRECCTQSVVAPAKASEAWPLMKEVFRELAEPAQFGSAFGLVGHSRRKGRARPTVLCI